ncbi:MAG: cobyric acid synthase [Chloroflexi bacterium]|nr:cobyric acid synthase [Chloroflexota bacterium]
MPAKTLMLQGTASHVGKSVITAAFCRLFARQGYRVAPFKAQNMSNNSFVTRDGGEMGRAQVFQAQAAGVEPHVDMNPILLKPGADTSAQVVVLGQPINTMDVKQYHDYQQVGYEAVQGALSRLRAQYDLIVIEGAGSPAEINLRGRDIVNMKVAKLANAPVFLIGDIERGGVFASLVGTMSLLTPLERKHVKGFIVNKFRGDASLLDSGYRFLERKTKVPVLGTLPYLFGIPVDEEDAVSIKSQIPNPTQSVPTLKIGVIHLPHISNATDYAPLNDSADVDLYYIESPNTFGTPDVVIIPGTKSTVADYQWMQRQGLTDPIRDHVERGGWMIGICGGYQMMGREVKDEEGIESGGAVSGLNLLPVVTTFQSRKQLTQVEAVCAIPELGGARVRGYEIHQGRTRADGDTVEAFKITRLFDRTVNQSDGAGTLKLFGTYLHGLFDHSEFRGAYLNCLRQHKGLAPLPPHAYDTRAKNFDQLADWLQDYLDMRRVKKIVGL